MRKSLYIILLLLSFPLFNIMAQDGFSIGLGGGPNFFYGDVSEEENVGYTFQLDTRYEFNSAISATLSYSFNHLQASKYSDGATTLYFNTAANNLDLHLGLDILQLTNLTSPTFPLKVILDFGGGYSFFDEGLYYGDYFPSKEDELNYSYKESHGKGSSAKIHMGGEVAYNIDNRLSLYCNLLGHYYFTSDVDGYAHYSGEPDKPTFNDTYISTTIGARYNLKGVTFRSISNSLQVKKQQKSNRYSGKKTAEISFQNNKAREPKGHPMGRWFGKKQSEDIPRTSNIQRFQGKKTNGGLAK